MVSKVKHSILSVSWQVCLCSLVCYILLSMFLLCHSIQLMLFFLLLKKIFVFRKRILSGNVDPNLVVCITIGWMPIKHKYQFVRPIKHNQLVSLVLTRNIVLQNQNFELIMCLYIFDIFFFTKLENAYLWMAQPFVFHLEMHHISVKVVEVLVAQQVIVHQVPLASTVVIA